MRLQALTRFIALLMVVFMAACSSTQSNTTDSNETGSAETSAETGTADTSAVTPTETVEPSVSDIPLTADNFHNHPSNYDGSTGSSVVYFGFDESSVPAAAFETLRAHATYLKSNSGAKLRLEGHGDERGTREYNVALGERRALAVEKFLRVQGVSSSQLETVSYGEEKPAAYGQDAMSWAKNRRVQLNYTAGKP